MKPKPLASLNHLTVPVVRIVLLLTSVVIGVRTCAVPTDYAVRESSPHAGPGAGARKRASGNGSQKIKKGPAPTPAPSHNVGCRSALRPEARATRYPAAPPVARPAPYLPRRPGGSPTDRMGPPLPAVSRDRPA